MSTAARTWTVREAVPGDLDRINALFAATMGRARSLEHDRWKFWDSPFGKPYITIAENRGEIVGQYALWPTPMRLGKEKVAGAQSLDTMTHPDYQGQGMFTTLAKACFELAASRGCEVLFGFPNANSYPGFVRRLNWDHTGDIPAWSRPLLLSKHPRFARVPASMLDALTHFPRGDTRRGLEVQTGKPDAAQIESLLAARQEKDVCSIERSAAWYDWRFAPASGHDYEWLTARRNGAVVGWAVWGTDPLAEYPRALISELVGESKHALEALVACAVRRARAAGCATINTVTNIEQHRHALRSCGFWKVRSNPFIVRGMTARNLGANIHDHASWRIFGADLDTY